MLCKASGLESPIEKTVLVLIFFTGRCCSLRVNKKYKAFQGSITLDSSWHLYIYHLSFSQSNLGKLHSSKNVSAIKDLKMYVQR